MCFLLQFQGPNLVIHQSDEVLDNMGEWCKTQHGKVIHWLNFLVNVVKFKTFYFDLGDRVSTSIALWLTFQKNISRFLLQNLFSTRV